VSAPRIAATGGAGFIGRWAVRALLDQGASVTVLDLPDRPAWIPDSVRYIRGNVDDAAAVDAAVGDADGVCHLAFRMDIDGGEPLASHRVNVLGSTVVMDRALRHRVRRIVWGSSVMVYGPPHAYPNGTVAEDAEPMPRTFYGATKLTLEWTARAFRVQGLETVGLRFTTVFGPGRERPGAAPFGVTLFESAAARRSIRLPEGDRKAAMLYVHDAAQACARSLLAPRPLRDVYNISGFETTVRELADVVRRRCADVDVDAEPGGDNPWPTSIDCRAAQCDFGYAPAFDRDRACEDYLGFLKRQPQAS